ncbi:aldehyde dehydrogenase family 7, member A1, isoform, partial [mine drainage metagenome]
MAMIIMASSDKKKQELFERMSLAETSSGTFYGKWAKSTATTQIKSFSPIDGSLLASVTPTSKADYDRAVSFSEKEYGEWVELPPPKRGSIMLKIGQALR